jgi:hypothetical protein
MTRDGRAEDEAPRGPDQLGDVERRILQAVRSLEYGSIEIVVHDARVVQIERREKVRFDKRAGEPGDGVPDWPPRHSETRRDVG